MRISAQVGLRACDQFSLDIVQRRIIVGKDILMLALGHAIIAVFQKQVQVMCEIGELDVDSRL